MLYFVARETVHMRQFAGQSISSITAIKFLIGRIAAKWTYWSLRSGYDVSILNRLLFVKFGSESSLSLSKIFAPSGHKLISTNFGSTGAEVK